MIDDLSTKIATMNRADYNRTGVHHEHDTDTFRADPFAARLLRCRVTAEGDWDSSTAHHLLFTVLLVLRLKHWGHI